MDALATVDAPTIAAYLYGDEVVANQGYATVGLPNFAGLGVAYRLTETYLRRTGKSITEAIVSPGHLIWEMAYTT